MIFFTPRFSFRYRHHSPRACNAPLKAYYPISGVREEGRPLHGNFPITGEHVNCRCYLDSCLTGSLRVLAEKKTARLCVKKTKKTVCGVKILKNQKESEREREKGENMHALVNAFMRCLSFLLPPSWLCVSFCLWVGKECEDTLPPRPNPRARFKSRKPLTYEEVAAAAAEAQGGSSPSVSSGPGCVSPAATSPAAPQGPPSGRIWIGGLWRAVERVFGAPWVLLRHHWCPEKRRAALRTPYPVCAFEPSEIKSFQGGAAAAATTSAEAGKKGAGGRTLTHPSNMSGSVGIPEPNPALCAPDASAELGVDEVITVDQHTQEMGTVTITVAIQAAEDEEPEEVSSNHIDFLGGSCSEDELGRHDKSRFESVCHFVAGDAGGDSSRVCEV